ncbi:uncharacterized protein J3R85_016923 [Psidium guajava]|nr:uncharacterized protein J3R85_016923 [Psidium guajava]
MIGTGGDSGPGLGSKSQTLSHQEIDFGLVSFKSRRPALSEDSFCDGNGNAVSTSPDKSAIGSGSSKVDSPTCSHLEGCGFDPDTSLRLSRDCIGDGGHDSFLTSPENTAIGCGSSSSRVDSTTTCSQLAGCGFDPDTSLRLSRD